MAIHETFKGPADLIAALRKPKVVIVAAMGRNRELGKGDRLLWHIPEDLKRFKALTLGHPVIMGRKTFESIVSYIGTPLPNRTNIVITRDPGYEQGCKDRGFDDVIVTHSLDEAFAKARSAGPSEIHIGGGAQLYEQALPHVDELRLTLIDDEKEADTFFPPYEADFTVITSDERHEHDGISYRWVDLKRA